MTTVDAWIDAIPDNVYAPCPCGCGMKFRFAMKEGIAKHEERFAARFEAEKETHDQDTSLGVPV
jgi:hypothetical protein